MGTLSLFDAVVGGPPIEYNSRENRWHINNIAQYIKTWDLSPTMSGYPLGWSISKPVTSDSIVVNNLLERAKELKADALLNIVEANQMWPSIRSLATCLPEMARNWRNIRKVLRTASGSYLAWKFGISPIISDIQSIRKFAPDMARSIKRFANGDLSRYSTRMNGVATFYIAGTASSYNGVKYYEAIYTGLAEKAPLATYVLVVKPSVHYQSDLFNRLQSCIDRFSSSPASLAWELVPFSFVADWFVDMRGILRELDTLVGFQPFEIVSLTKSFTYKVRTNARLVFRTPCNGSTIMDLTAGSHLFSHYERSHLSSRQLFPEWKVRFGKNQAAVSAALITQKLSAIR
jgi:hypothetical protein